MICILYFTDYGRNLTCQAFNHQSKLIIRLSFGLIDQT